jgi:hypothetical protein
MLQPTETRRKTLYVDGRRPSLFDETFHERIRKALPRIQRSEPFLLGSRQLPEKDMVCHVEARRSRFCISTSSEW